MRERTFAGLSGKHHQGAEDAVGYSITGAMNVGFDRPYWSLRPAVVLGQTDTNVLCPKQECKHLDGTRPFRLVPSVVRHKHSLTPDRTNRLDQSILGNFYRVTS